MKPASREDSVQPSIRNFDIAPGAQKKRPRSARPIFLYPVSVANPVKASAAIEVMRPRSADPTIAIAVSWAVIYPSIAPAISPLEDISSDGDEDCDR
jgi:hypothetical protein